MTAAHDILAEARARDIAVLAEGDNLRLSAPHGALNDDLRSRIETEKPAIIEALQNEKPVDVDTRPSWKPFPVAALPEPFRAYVADTAHARQWDPTAVALPLLAALAGTIGNARVVQIGRDWLAPAVLWTVVVAPSGAVKSPPFRAALYPARKIDSDARQEWEEQHGDPRSARMRHDAEVAAWRKKKNGGDPPAPMEPVPRLLVEDATLQALAAVLAENARGVLLARDELSGWVRSFDQFTGAAGADLARWLEIYGAGALRVDRKADGHTFVRQAAVSITGTIQTAILPLVFGEQQQAAGLLARMLLAAPPEPARKWSAIRDAKKPDVSKLLRRFQSLRSLDLADDGKFPTALPLSPVAEGLYGDWFTAHDARRRKTEPGAWRSALSKLEEIPCRVALVLVLAGAEEPGAVEEVDGDTMRRAIELTNWFRAEGERVYSLLAETPQESAHRELEEWLT